MISLIAITALFNSLDPKSISQTLAFYEVHPEHRPALQRAYSLLNTNIERDVQTVAYALHSASENLSEHDIEVIERLAKSLPNRKLKGYLASSEEEVINLKEEEIDLGVALILSQVKDASRLQVRKFSAMLDLMALEILARLPREASQYDKIQEMNRFIFEQKHFRFPPQSIYAEKIDKYTFLPYIMDNHLGVCLGVTTIYLSIAQRVDLKLEIITPPGHIYVRHRDVDKIINIETTARGINVPSEAYMSINTTKLQERTIREVIGMTHVNQASVYLHSKQYDRAVASYEKALPYMLEDPLLKELLGYSYLFVGRMDEGKILLEESVCNENLVKQGIAEDYLNGVVGLDGIEAIFSKVDETRDSILSKQGELQEIMKKYPCFREGLNQLAITWMQLNRSKEAIDVLEKYNALDSSNPVISYYLAALYEERHDFKNSWLYLKHAEDIFKKHSLSYKVLRDLRKSLISRCPE